METLSPPAFPSEGQRDMFRPSRSSSAGSPLWDKETGVLYGVRLASADDSREVLLWTGYIAVMGYIGICVCIYEESEVQVKRGERIASRPRDKVRRPDCAEKRSYDIE